jgi:hypothetical protein
MMEDEKFKKFIRLAERRECIVAAAIARKYGASLSFPTKLERVGFDYRIFDLNQNLNLKFEQKNSSKDKLCIELCSFHEDGKRKGVFQTCKADRFIWVDHKRKQVFNYDWPLLKSYIVLLDYEEKLNILDQSKDAQKWKKTHDTNPTAFCLINHEDALGFLGEQASVNSFSELNLPEEF